MKLFFLFLNLFMFNWELFSQDHPLNQEICSRTAEINYQEVVVDTISTKRGDGLRYYLEKNDESRKLLNEYQDRSGPKWHQAALGSVGSVMVLGGLFYSDGNNNGIFKKSNLLISGLSLILINALIYNTTQRENERYLKQAIDTYNQTNTPQIIFSPLQNIGEKAKNSSRSPGIFGEMVKDF